MRIDRLLVGIPVATAVTFGLFLLMDTLVDQKETTAEKASPNVTISFLPEVEDTPPVLTDRLKRPEKAEVMDTPDPEPSRSSGSDAIKISLDVTPNLDPTDLGSGAANQDETPVVRVGPLYPSRAQGQGVEGWVIVQFDVMASGRVDPESVVVVDAQPKKVFDRSAINAVKKWKYRPKKVNGTPVRREGLQVQLTYDLD